MDERRFETRLLCAELVEVTWKDKSGYQRRRIANLEDISQSGACLQVELPILQGTAVTLHYGNGVLVGAIRYCVYRDFGYFLGVRFEEGCQWSTKHFRPRHLLDPSRLVRQAIKKSRPEPPVIH